jgi:hypothetical protein
MPHEPSKAPTTTREEDCPTSGTELSYGQLKLLPCDAKPWPVRVAFFRGHDDELVELPEDKTVYT